VVFWELFAGGKNPCPSELTHLALANKVINEAWRPRIPFICPQEWSGLIEQCWAQNPSVRPEFNFVVETLKKGTENPPEVRSNASDAFSEFGDSLSSEAEAGSEAEERTETEGDNGDESANQSQLGENPYYDANIS